MKETTIVLEKNLIVSYLEEIEKKVKDEIGKKIDQLTIDFSKSAVVDSSGIGLLVKIHNTLKKTNGTLKIVGLQDDVKKMLMMMNLNRHFEIE